MIISNSHHFRGNTFFNYPLRSNNMEFVNFSCLCPSIKFKVISNNLLSQWFSSFFLCIFLSHSFARSPSLSHSRFVHVSFQNNLIACNCEILQELHLNGSINLREGAYYHFFTHYIRRNLNPSNGL